MKILTLLVAGILLAAPAQAALEIGQSVPDFELSDLDGETHKLSEYLEAGKTVVLEWFNPDCPFIVKHHAHAKTMDETFASAKESDVVWLAINSGAPGKQGHGLKRNRNTVTT